MRLFLIRHGETVHNVAQVYAGVTDSNLTNHGVVQADLLGRYFVAQDIRFSHVFSSDLSRAWKTAEAICRAQSKLKDSDETITLSPVQLSELREQDFGPLEGKTFSTKPKESSKVSEQVFSDFKDLAQDGGGVETKESMIRRSKVFIDDHLLPIMSSEGSLELQVVAVVAHGLILSTLWRSLLRRFPPSSVIIGPNALPADRPVSLEHLGAWSNTGFLDLHIGPSSSTHVDRVEAPVPALDKLVPEAKSDASPQREEVVDEPAEATAIGSTFSGMVVTIKTVNGQAHLRGLKRTRGGVGSSGHDASQQKIETLFKKQRAA